MLFNSFSYLVFLPVVVLFYYLTAPRFRWILLFIASCYFYMYFIPKYILILFLLIAIDYVAALAIHRAKGTKRKVFLAISLIANISLLSFFKYIYFLFDIYTDLAPYLHIDYRPKLPDVILPIGLSFHTFQSMAYTIDVYRGKQEPEKHLGIFAVYVLFFPQMVAGPIERFSHLGRQLKETHLFRLENIINGLRLVLFGLFIKMAVADMIAPVVNHVYDHTSHHSSLHIWIASILFSFQIYADFWGYSTIAVGSALMMGITLMDNFRAPYFSRSISEFWTRWHISLSSWFKEYLYIPLGGNRVNTFRWCLNILIVFAISGLWHGANWTFVIWGLIHALMYLVERFGKPLSTFISTRVKNTLGTIVTFTVVTLAWIFFRSEDFTQAKKMLYGLFANRPEELDLPANYRLWVPFCLFILFDVILKGQRFDTWISRLSFPQRWGLYMILLFCITILAYAKERPFIYFQF